MPSLFGPEALAGLGHVWMNSVVIDVRRYVIFAVAVWFILWVVFAGLLRSRKIREASPKFQQLALEFAYSIRSMALFATVSVGIFLMQRAGLYPLTHVAAGWGPAWWWASLILVAVGHDAYFYWTHRLMHRPRWFRRTHRRHHKSNNPSPFTAYSFDLAEAALMVAFVVVWPLAVPTSPGVIDVFMLYQIFRNTLLHCGYELMPARADGRPWLDWMTTTTHHDLHHAQAGYNYAAWFTWWDRWMGTEHPEYYARYALAAGVSHRLTAAAAAPEAQPAQA